MAIAYVNSLYSGLKANVSAIVFGAQNHATGNLVVVGMACNAGVTVNSVTDTAGNTYTRAKQHSSPDGWGIEEIWYAKNVTGHSSNVVSVNLSGITSYGLAVQHQYSGADATAPLDVTAEGSVTNAASVTSGSFTPTTGTGVAVGFGFNGQNGQAYSAGANYTLRLLTFDFAGSEDRLNAPASSQTATINIGYADNLDILVAVFKETGSPPPPVDSSGPSLDAGYPVNANIQNSAATSVAVSCPATAGSNRIMVAVVNQKGAGNTTWPRVSGLGLDWVLRAEAKYGTTQSSQIWTAEAPAKTTTGNVTAEVASTDSAAKTMQLTVYALTGAIIRILGGAADDTPAPPPDPIPTDPALDASDGPYDTTKTIFAMGGVYVEAARALPVFLTNNSGASVTVASVSVEGSTDLAADMPNRTVIANGGVAWLKVTWAPRAAGSLNATVRVLDASGNTLSGITVTGTATELTSANSVSVLDYGAVANGSTNNTTPFQNAANAAAAAGKVLVIPAGLNYYRVVTNVDLNCDVVGTRGTQAWGTRPRIKMDTPPDVFGVTTYYLFRYFSRSNKVFTGLDLDGSRGGISDWIGGVYLSASSGIKIENCRIGRMRADGVTVGGYTVGESPNTSILISNNVFYDSNRCAITPQNVNGARFILNDLSKNVYYQSLMDMEPWHDTLSVWNVHVAYNRWSFGVPENGILLAGIYGDPAPENDPGGNIYIYDNYGTILSSEGHVFFRNLDYQVRGHHHWVNVQLSSRNPTPTGVNTGYQAP